MIAVFATGFSEYDLELRSSLIRLAEDGLTYLAQHTISQGQAEIDFHASFSAAKLTMHGVTLLPDLISQRINEIMSVTMEVCSTNIYNRFVHVY